MKTAKIVTIKPQDSQIEYAIYQDADLLSHGHILTIELTPEQTGTDLQAAVDAAALDNGLLPEPE